MVHNSENTYQSGKEGNIDILISGNEFVNNIIDAANEGIWVIDNDKRTRFVNQRLSEMLGYQQEEILRESPFSFSEKEDRAKLIGHLENIFNGKREKFELKYTRKNGLVLWTSVSAVPVYNGSSDPQAVLAMLTDITEQKKAARHYSDNDLYKLAERRSAELTTLLELIPDAVYIGTKEGISQCNTAALKMLGAESLPDLQNRIGELGRKFNVRWPGSGQLLGEDELQFTRALKGETIVENVVASNMQTGEDIHIRASDAPIIVNGEIIGAVAINTDISERRKIEEELRLRETQLDSFFANSPVILNLVDENFCYINTDRLTPTYYGLNRETIRGKCVPELSPDFIGQTGKSMRRVLETGEPILNEPFESPVPGREGEMAYWQTSFFRVPLGDGKWGIGVISTEITELKRSEAKLLESEDRFHTLADNISQLAWMADGNGSVVWYNKRWYDYTGTTFEDMKGWGWKKVHHPDHLDRVVEKFRLAKETGDIWEDIFPMRKKDGSYRWFLSRALPIRDETNNIIRWFGTNTDITEQKLVEEQLHEALLQAEEGRNTLNALMDYIPMGITIAAAPDVNILMVSRYGQDLLEKTDEEISGIPAPEHPSKWGTYRSDGITPGTPEELPLSRATMKGEIVKNEEWYVTRKDGTLIPILCNAAPILDRKGNITGGVIGWQDIGELKRIHREMQLRNEELTRFVYTVSHDLKSPLITIQMFISNLKDDINDQNVEAQMEDIRFIENAAVKMERLLRELLELSRVGRKEQVKSEVTLETIVQSAIDLVTGRIRERNVKIKITAPPVMLYGYSQRLIQLYQNLIDNAVKFMGDQTSPIIEIGAFEDDHKQLILFVSDNGIGIDKQYHDKVFNLFEKLNPATEGTGIGLALVKRVVEVHDGRIWLSSRGENQGTTFYFTIEKSRIINPEN